MREQIKRYYISQKARKPTAKVQQNLSEAHQHSQRCANNALQSQLWKSDIWNIHWASPLIAMSDGLHQNKTWNRNWVKLWIVMVMVHLLHKMNVESSTMVGCQDTSTPKDWKHWVKADESRTQTFLLRSYYVPTTFLPWETFQVRPYDHTTMDPPWHGVPRSPEVNRASIKGVHPKLSRPDQSIGQSRSIKTMVTICYHGSAILFLESL